MVIDLKAVARPYAETPSYDCPLCLRRVCATETTARRHRETYPSGSIAVQLLHCPTCGTSLAAHVVFDAPVAAAPG